MHINTKAIIINGFARGGTNVLWNIMQSHPNICSPIYETNQIIGARANLSPVVKILINNPKLAFFMNLPDYVNKRFFHYKQKNFYHEDNKYKCESELYSIDEIKRATLCIKGVFGPTYKDIQFSDLLDRAFMEAYHIALIRDGFSLCEGWMRRGIAPAVAGMLYTEFMKRVNKGRKKFRHYCIVDFDDLLLSPFAWAEKLFRFCNEKPYVIDQIRLKVKKTVGKDGEHIARYGKEHKKYWFDRNHIGEILDPDVSDIQKGKLTDKERELFAKHAREGLIIYNDFRKRLGHRTV